MIGLGALKKYIFILSQCFCKKNQNKKEFIFICVLVFFKLMLNGNSFRKINHRFIGHGNGLDLFWLKKKLIFISIFPKEFVDEKFIIQVVWKNVDSKSSKDNFCFGFDQITIEPVNSI